LNRSCLEAARCAALAEELTKAGADWQIIGYGGTVHSFTNPDAGKVGMTGIAYNKSADERSWKAMRAFFDEIFA
jgi:dienelactone hydrolase